MINSQQQKLGFLPCYRGNVWVYVWDVTTAFQESSPMSELCTPGASKQTCVSFTVVETTKS